MKEARVFPAQALKFSIANIYRVFQKLQRAKIDGKNTLYCANNGSFY